MSLFEEVVMVKIIEIDEKKLREKIDKIERKYECSLNFESAKKLIEKIQGEYSCHSLRKDFVNLVKEWAKKLELPFNYCRVAFSYLSSKKRGAQKNKNTEHLQYHLAIR